MPAPRAFRSVKRQAMGTIISAAAMAAFAIPAALLTPDPELESVSGVLQGAATGFVLLAAIATYVFLSLWQMAVSHNLERQHHEKADTWKIWAGWFIPVAYLFWPLTTMARLNSRNPMNQVWLAVWWLGWIAALLGSRTPGVDYLNLGEVPRVADAMVVVGSIAAWLGLTTLVRGISVRHIAPEPIRSTSVTPDGTAVNPLDLLKRRD